MSISQKSFPDAHKARLYVDRCLYYASHCFKFIIFASNCLLLLAVQEHGTFSYPSEYEVSLLEYQSTLGCLADARLFHLDATTFVGLDPPKEVISMTNWSFIPDVHGVPGMIGFGSSADEVTATFELPCPGKRSVLDIEYLVSYIGMGAIILTVTGIDVDEPSLSVVVDGLWKTRSSLQQHQVFYLPDKFGPIRVTFELLSPQKEESYSTFLADEEDNSTTSDSIRADRKFKLVRIQCC